MSRDDQYEDLLHRYQAAGGADLREQLHDRYLQLARGGTTSQGLPYPDPNDPISEGADAIRTLAEAVGARTPQVTVGPTAPADPQLNDLWFTDV